MRLHSEGVAQLAAAPADEIVRNNRAVFLHERHPRQLATLA